MSPPINVFTSNASCKMSGRMKELLANDDMYIAKTAEKEGATVQRNIRHRRRKSMPHCFQNIAQKNIVAQPNADGTEPPNDIVEPITDDWDAFETVSFDGDDIVDEEGRLIQSHKHRHYRRRHRHQEGVLCKINPASSCSGSDSEEDIDEDVYLTYPAGQEQSTDEPNENNVVMNTYAYTIKVTHFHQLPSWLQDNEFLLSCHRLPLATAWECARSMFHVHTETGNIWTHLLGCLLFILTACAFYLANKQVEFEAKIVFGVFFMGAIGCLGLSTAFHTMSCHNRLAHLFCKLDYVGISLLIVTSIIPWLYYGFYCRPAPKYFYMILTTVCGGFTISVSLMDKFSSVAFRPLRAGVFVLTAMSGTLPMLHFWITDGYTTMSQELALSAMASMGLVYIIGALVYALRIPERFMPGKCDIWFQSHQLFHLFVVAAAFMHYNGISEMASLRLGVNTCAIEAVERRWADWLPMQE